VEDLDKTATNILIATLFTDNSVSEYEVLYFKEIDRVTGLLCRSESIRTSATIRFWPIW
jgi:hypothetical protein